MKNSPNYLYHYTSIESLALILKNQTFRFRRLDLLDDPEEGKSNDFKRFGRFMFASCWTDISEESLPMWSMYAGQNMKGVRIKLPIHIFSKKYFNNLFYTSNQILVEKDETFFSYIDIENPILKDYSVVPIQENLLKEVIYTNNETLLYPNIFIEKVSNNGHINKETKSINFNNLGRYKQKYWTFQNEYRYMFHIAPWSRDELFNSTLQKHLAIFERLKTNNLNIEYYDESVDFEKFKDMTITMSPKLSDGEKLIVQLLIKEYNPNARIEESIIKIK